MSTAWCFCESQLADAMARSAAADLLTDADRALIAAFLRSESAAKLRIQPSKSPGGLSPEGAYTPTSERIA